MLLALKLVLVPALVAAVTLGARRWGPRIGGWLTGLPIVAGPTLLFLAAEQGDTFAAEAARATLVGLIGVAAFGLAYAWLALRMAWPVCLWGGWVAFGLTTGPLHAVAWPPLAALAGTVASFAIAQRALPRAAGPAAPAPPPAWDLPLRMAGALAIVLSVTYLADRLGPRLSGALTPFPVALAVVLAFTHAQQGLPPALRLLRGFFPAMWGFGLFCFVLAVATARLGIAMAFGLALAAQLAVHAAVLALYVARSDSQNISSTDSRREARPWRKV